MKGLNMQPPTKEKFDYKVYARYCKSNPPEAQKYRESFLENGSTSREEITTEVQTIPNDTTIITDEKVTEITYSKEDIEHLRKLYTEKHPENKKPFSWWKGEVLVQKINDLSNT